MKNSILKTVIMFISIFSVQLVCGQTKEETEKWILEKLNLYGAKEEKLYRGSGSSEYFTHKNRIYQLDGTNLIYTFNSYDSYNYEREDIKYHYVIPLWAIESISLEYDRNHENTILKFILKKYCKDCKLEHTWKKEETRSKREEYDYFDKKYRVTIKKWRTVEIPTGYYHYHSDNKEEITSVVIPFKSDPEENFIERFKKAIEHLQTFYPKPEKKKETF